MTLEEQSLFYKELVRRGISIFPSPEGIANELQVVVQKVLTTVDQRVYLEGVSKCKGFVGEDEAIQFVKQFVDWNYQVSDEQELPVAEAAEEFPLVRFNMHMMIDIGFGPQNVALGEISTNCQGEDWFNTIEQEAKLLSERYLKTNYPDMKIDDIKRQVKVMPCF